MKTTFRSICRWAVAILIGTLLARFGLGTSDLEFWGWLVSFALLLAAGIAESEGP